MPSINNPDGVYADVNDEHMLYTESVMIPIQNHVNINHGEVYSVIVDQAIAGAAHFFYMKNTNDITMWVARMKGFVSADVELYILRGVTGTATTPTTLTPVNRNFGSGNSADGTFQQGASLAMTGGTEIERWSVDFSEKLNFNISWINGFLLPKNATIVVAGSAAATINMTTTIYFHSSC